MLESNVFVGRINFEGYKESYPLRLCKYHRDQDKRALSTGDGFHCPGITNDCRSSHSDGRFSGQKVFTTYLHVRDASRALIPSAARKSVPRGNRSKTIVEKLTG